MGAWEGGGPMKKLRKRALLALLQIQLEARKHAQPSAHSRAPAGTGSGRHRQEWSGEGCVKEQVN
jgi:hypothetical protein